MSIRALQDYVFYSHYAKHLPAEKRRETWKEAVNRVFDMHRTQYSTFLAASPELAKLFDIAEKALQSKQILGSQRAMQFGGAPILKKHERIYNCSSTHIDRPRVFQECLYLLLCGVGVGFSTQFCHVNKLPKIAKRTKTPIKYVIEDSVEGWADAVGVLMSSYFVQDQPFPQYAGHHINFDFSAIRPRGALISWGGIAPGPEGLETALRNIDGLLYSRFEKEASGTVQMPPIDCYDIIMHLSDSVLSGGIRRCLPETYNILMSDGSYKKISEVKIGDKIRYNEKVYPITSVFDNGVQSLLKIKTANGYHISTPNHKWLVYDHTEEIVKWLSAKDIRLDSENYSFVEDDSE